MFTFCKVELKYFTSLSSSWPLTYLSLLPLGRKMQENTETMFALQQEGLQAISDLESSLRNFQTQLEQDTSGQNGERVKQEIPALQQDALRYVGRIEEAMVQGFPFKVPEKYANLPQLKVTNCMGLLQSKYKSFYRVSEHSRLVEANHSARV